MKFSEIKNRAVVDITSAKRVGNLDNLVVNPETQEVIGLKVKSGLLSSPHYIGIGLLKNVGPDAITVDQMEDLFREGKMADAHEHPLRTMPDLSSLINRQVVAQSGSLIGVIDDFYLDPAKLSITDYEISRGGLFSKKYKLPRTPEINFGPTLVVIPNELAPQNDAS